MSAVVRDGTRGKESSLRGCEGLCACLRVSESVGRCARKMKIGVSTADVWLKCPEANEDDSCVAGVRDGMKCGECGRRAERRRKNAVGALGLGWHVENGVERRKRKLVRDVCAGDK